MSPKVSFSVRLDMAGNVECRARVRAPRSRADARFSSIGLANDGRRMSANQMLGRCRILAIQTRLLRGMDNESNAGKTRR